MYKTDIGEADRSILNPSELLSGLYRPFTSKEVSSLKWYQCALYTQMHVCSVIVFVQIQY